MQAHGEGASCPVKFKECSAPTGICGRGPVLILLVCLNSYAVPGKHCTCLSSPACPCLYLRMVAQNRWFPDIVKIKKKSQLEVLTVRMQAVACGACAFLLKIDHLWEEPGCIVCPLRLLQHCSC